MEDSKPVKKEEESNKSSVNKKVAKVKKEEVESVKKEPKAVTVKKEPKAVTVKKELKVKKEIDDDILLVRRTPNSKVSLTFCFWSSTFSFLLFYFFSKVHCMIWSELCFTSFVWV